MQYRVLTLEHIYQVSTFGCDNKTNKKMYKSLFLKCCCETRKEKKRNKGMRNGSMQNFY